MIFSRYHLIGALKLPVSYVIVGLLAGSPALAAPPPGVDPDSPSAVWYHGLRDGTGASCCDVSDCRHLPTRIGAHGYEVFAGEQWVPVPPDKILPNKDNPTGEPVVCWSPWRGVMCFIEGTGV